jgi:hypothetical protein
MYLFSMPIIMLTSLARPANANTITIAETAAPIGITYFMKGANLFVASRSRSACSSLIRPDAIRRWIRSSLILSIGMRLVIAVALITVNSTKTIIGKSARGAGAIPAKVSPGEK